MKPHTDGMSSNSTLIILMITVYFGLHTLGPVGSMAVVMVIMGVDEPSLVQPISVCLGRHTIHRCGAGISYILIYLGGKGVGGRGSGGL